MLPDERIARVGVNAEILRERIGTFGKIFLSNRPSHFHREKIDEIVEEFHIFRRSFPGK